MVSFWMKILSFWVGEFSEDDFHQPLQLDLNFPLLEFWVQPKVQLAHSKSGQGIARARKKIKFMKDGEDESLGKGPSFAIPKS